MPDATAILARMKATCEAATKGPWAVHPNPRYYVALPTDEDGDSNRDANAEFCAQARTGWPATIRALEAAIEVLNLCECEITVRQIQAILEGRDALHDATKGITEHGK